MSICSNPVSCRSSSHRSRCVHGREVFEPSRRDESPRRGERRGSEEVDRLAYQGLRADWLKDKVPPVSRSHYLSRMSHPARRPVIVAGLRTPFAKSGTVFKDVTAVQLARAGH